MTISPYFDKFPKIQYDINGDGMSYETVTNIFKRFGILRNILSNATSYVLYEIEENDTPEILAEKVYKDTGAGWIILYANKILDPQFDWPMSDTVFKDYIVEKYGSIANAQTTYHHYEKIVETTVDGVTHTRTYVVNQSRLTQNKLNVPYTYYTPYGKEHIIISADMTIVTADGTSYTVDNTIDPAGIILTADLGEVTTDSTLFTIDINNHYIYDDTSLPEYYSYEEHDINGKAVYLNTYGNAVSNYDYELQQNDARRFIKVIKAGYYPQIMREFVNLTTSLPSYVRTF
mgnify:CR=1 FL=1